MKWLLLLVMLMSLFACRSQVNLQPGGTLVTSKGRTLDKLNVYVAPPVDQRAVQDRIGERLNLYGAEVWAYTSDTPLTEQLHGALKEGFVAAGAELVEQPELADFQVSSIVTSFRVTTQDMMVTSTTEGEVALEFSYLDSNGYLLGERSFSTPFQAEGIVPEAIKEHLLVQVAEAVGEGELIAKEAALEPKPDPSDQVADGEGVDDGVEVESRRVFLRFVAPKKAAETLEAKGAYFQGQILEAGATEFAGSAEMEEVYASLCDDIGVSGSETRKCRLQAARRLFVDEVIELEAHLSNGVWEITMEVWNPESNGMVAAKAINLGLSDLNTTASQALPILACDYLSHRRISVSACEAE